MDKKNILIGVMLIIAAGVVFIYGPTTAEQSPAPIVNPSSPVGPNQAPSAAYSGLPESSPSDASFAAMARENGDARLVVLANEFISARFTNYGGAIKDIAFKKYPATLGGAEPFVFNESHADPIFAFTSDAFTKDKIDRSVPYVLVSQSTTEVVFRAIYENRIEVLRRYRIVPTGAPKEAGDPYRIRHEVTFRNLSDQAAPLPPFSFNIGTAAPVNERDIGMYLTSGYNNGDKSAFIERSKLEGSGGFLGMGAHAAIPYILTQDKLVWASVSNQFFTGILTPDVPGRGMITRRIELPALYGMSTAAHGLTVNATFDVPALAPDAETTLGFSYYAGPKEYTRLRYFEHNEEDVMQFGSGWYRKIMLSGVFAPLMNTLMNFMHGFVGQWGVAIVLMTLLLKIITLPFTLKASRAAKKMQKIQPEMQAMKEKFKDNPTKMNQATMELFKKHKVNPMGGCLPILITMPLFIAFFTMLQGPAELRFQSFLWAKDLAAPDTIGHLNLGFIVLPINIMPLLMGATMFFQMRLTPSPSVDNAQAKMMRFMPVIFTFFCYSFSCALALYSTINGLFTIGQQLIINRMHDKEPLAATATGPSAVVSNGKRPIKNVTPPKKKK